MDLPLTNIEKFEKIKFRRTMFDIPFEFEEYFYISGGNNKKKTVHGTYKHEYEIEEGIQIIWKDNPFNVDFNDDNYLILTNKRKK